nr:MAG TPA: hypothetical protein [Caudoviricetes sp.]
MEHVVSRETLAARARHASRSRLRGPSATGQIRSAAPRRNAPHDGHDGSMVPLLSDSSASAAWQASAALACAENSG